MRLEEITFNGIQRDVDHSLLLTIVGHGGTQTSDIGVLAVECLEGFRLKVFFRFYFHGNNVSVVLNYEIHFLSTVFLAVVEY